MRDDDKQALSYGADRLQAVDIVQPLVGRVPPAAVDRVDESGAGEAVGAVGKSVDAVFDDDGEVLTWPDCARPVVLYRLPSGGHDWPALATDIITAMATRFAPTSFAP